MAPAKASARPAPLRLSTPVERDTAAVPTHEIDELLLLSSWFRRFPEELDRTRIIDLAPLHESASGAA